MDQSSRDAVTFTLGTFVTVCTIIALGVKFILLPWLRDHLVQPVQRVHHEVTANNHKSATPTIPDRLEDLSTKVDEATQAHELQSRDMKAFRLVLDEHLRWSDRWVDVVDRELQLLKEELAHKKRTETEE